MGRFSQLGSDRSSSGQGVGSGSVQVQVLGETVEAQNNLSKMAKFTKRAVLVGCNYPHTRFRLNGCTNDVKSIKAVIKERFGFLESNIQVLIDDDHIGASGSSPVLPTGANIKAALDEMAKKAKAGDVLFFYFSGHGTAIPVLKAGKPFRQDEAIVSCDLNLITDVDLRRFVSRLKKGVSFTMLSDSCHSGGLIEKWRKQNVASWDRTPENHDAEDKAKAKFLGFDFIESRQAAQKHSSKMANVTKRAVLVGCNYPLTKNRLYGCMEDVKAIKRVIMDKLGFHESNIQVLTDDDHDGATASSNSLLPTGANIKAALNDMAKRAKAGDVLFFYFSGHGTAIPVLEAGKPFRQDEAIVPCDLNLVTKQCYADVDFRRLVNRLPEGTSFTILSDSCQTGALIDKGRNGASKKRKNQENSPMAKGKTKAKFLGFEFIHQTIIAAAGFPQDGGNTVSQAAHKIFGNDVSFKFHPHYIGGAFELDPLLEDEGILLSGFEADEASYDIVSDDRAFGAFTDAVVTILKDHKSATISNGELLDGAAEALEKQGYEQIPCLYCSDKNTYKPFLGGFA
ncbi:hypothetical protein GQ457_05G033170 [Hibiscus cannabinus]